MRVKWLFTSFHSGKTPRHPQFSSNSKASYHTPDTNSILLVYHTTERVIRTILHYQRPHTICTTKRKTGILYHHTDNMLNSAYTIGSPGPTGVFRNQDESSMSVRWRKRSVSRDSKDCMPSLCDKREEKSMKKHTEKSKKSNRKTNESAECNKPQEITPFEPWMKNPHTASPPRHMFFTCRHPFLLRFSKRGEFSQARKFSDPRALATYLQPGVFIPRLPGSQVWRPPLDPMGSRGEAFSSAASGIFPTSIKSITFLVWGAKTSVSLSHFFRDAPLSCTPPPSRTIHVSATGGLDSLIQAASRLARWGHGLMGVEETV